MINEEFKLKGSQSFDSANHPVKWMDMQNYHFFLNKKNWGFIPVPAFYIIHFRRETMAFKT